jgi:hypothetical protein
MSQAQAADPTQALLMLSEPDVSPASTTTKRAVPVPAMGEAAKSEVRPASSSSSNVRRRKQPAEKVGRVEVACNTSFSRCLPARFFKYIRLMYLFFFFRVFSPARRCAMCDAPCEVWRRKAVPAMCD